MCLPLDQRDEKVLDKFWSKAGMKLFIEIRGMTEKGREIGEMLETVEGKMEE